MATTIVNAPPANNSSDNGIGLLIGIIVLIIVGGLLFYYGLPYVQQMTSGGIQVNVPKNIDVNVNQPK